jgi:UDP-N-acetylglucosamine:LPS N-acetylglucosamine transferase
MPGPRILILFSRTGGGHGRVAQTLHDHLLALEPGAEITMVDGLTETDLGVKVDPSRAFLTLTTTLIHLYNLNYRLTNMRWTVPLLRGLIRASFGRTLARIVRDAAPDLIISTHHFISPSTIASESNLPPCVMVVSDLGQPHRIWFDRRIQTVYVPSDEMAEYARSCLGAQRSHVPVETLGFPIEVGEVGSSVPNPTEGGLLIMGGGAGTGAIDRLVGTLARGLPDHRIVVVCGWNARLKRTIEAWQCANVEVHGFVNNVPELMARSDMVITKAGPVTIMEAVAAGRPLVITDWVGLQEEDNVSFVVDHGLGLYCPERANLPSAVATIYEHYAEFVAAKPRNVEHGPERIAAHMLRSLRKSADGQQPLRMLS